MAQLAARESHNLKVVSSILTRGKGGLNFYFHCLRKLYYVFNSFTYLYAYFNIHFNLKTNYFSSWIKPIVCKINIWRNLLARWSYPCRRNRLKLPDPLSPRLLQNFMNKTQLVLLLFNIHSLIKCSMRFLCTIWRYCKYFETNYMWVQLSVDACIS